MAPFVVIEMVEAVRAGLGEEAVEHLLKEAQLFRLPQLDEPVREDKAARIHQTVRKLWPDEARGLCSAAGVASAERIMEGYISEKAAQMLGGMPRATGAWLLAKTAHQNAWIFSGTGEFVVESEQRFILRENPLVMGEESTLNVCHFHASLFEKLFSTLIHPRLVCEEVSCHAKGDEVCVFEFTLGHGHKPALHTVI